MSRVLERFSALGVSRTRQPGMHPDGGGLYLQVTAAGARSWLFRYMIKGRERQMGLGSLSAVTLAEARAKATECRRLRQEGIDPIEARKKARVEAQLEAAKSISFGECAKAYIEGHRTGWRNAKHAQQWQNTLSTYVDPIFGRLPVEAIDTTLVLKAIEPIWTTKPETASRVRARIEAILDWAKVRGYRAGENPAAWRGHLDQTLPHESRVRKVRHHAALPYNELPAFIDALRKQAGTAARALEFLILTAARTGEVIGACPGEVNERDKVWMVPAERMKTRREHRVPLSEAALAVLDGVDRNHSHRFLFPGGNTGCALSNMAMLAVLKRMGREDLTVHGFRSTFRDWAAERTNFPREVAEMALAHSIADKVEAAYRRGDLYEKRRLLLEEWATYCTAAPITREVVPLRATAQ